MMILITILQVSRYVHMNVLNYQHFFAVVLAIVHILLMIFMAFLKVRECYGPTILLV